ncbi:MAG: ATP-dependent Clp protease proteolytic subunit [Candidatus Latescibacteria bacterium]|jgi:ATP-dependent Clp protease, protease subunit|nr:ATP-dependent Clp protease proteolytic subunit [Candidatus Latescibacterota bacterium]MBT4138863.1 ATP-dependent Clp protease proteolytic subunit [Candidatus Latescibacterota bacterium]
MVDEELLILEDEDEEEEEDAEGEEEGEEEGEDGGKAGPSFLGKGLMDARTILISDPVDHKLTAKVTAQLLFLDHEDQEKPIRIFINSPGGSVYDGFAIYDMIRFVRPKVKIISSGLSASAATVIMLAADKEDRMAMPNARIMIHQPSMRFQGAAEDVRRTAEEVLKIKKKINQMYADETGQSFEKVQEDTDRDYWMSPDEALEYGLISKIVHNHDEIDG